MSENAIEKNYKTYEKGLIKLFGEEIASAIINALGGKERVAKASYMNLAESGSAFEGSFIKNVIKMTRLANEINSLLPENSRASVESINKVCMLSQIAKVLLYEENDNNWEIINRGMVYKYNKLDGALRVGERSCLIASNAGIKFTEIEYEAMRILDKSPEDDSFTKYFSSSLSTVVRQAAELVTMINRIDASNESSN